MRLASSPAPGNSTTTSGGTAVHVGHGPALDPSPGACVPFGVLMLVLAFTPLTPLAHVWEPLRHKAAVMLIFVVPIWIYYGVAFGQAGVDAMVTQLVDWINFICLIGPLYMAAGGVYMDYDELASPKFNTLYLAGGALLTNVTGTTGACMIMIRLFVHRNKPRLAHFHLCFFIMIIGNVSGLLTPLGDPPMFIGFLKGVPFLWMLTNPNMVGSWILCVCYLLVLFFVLDTLNYRKHVEAKVAESSASKFDVEKKATATVEFAIVNDASPTTATDDLDEDEDDPEAKVHLVFKGYKSLCGFVVIILIVIVQGLPIYPSGSRQAVTLIASAFQVTFAFLLHFFIEDKENYRQNKFSHTPIVEVVIIFFGLFMTLAPVLNYLQFHALELGITQPVQFFWITGSLSAVLDNAPTYLTFAGLAAGQFNGTSFNDDPVAVTILLQTSPQFNRMLEAVSMGAVFFGAITYLGNAPNLMVKGTVEAMIRKGHGYPPHVVPGFFEYMGIVVPVLLPAFVLVMFIIGV